MYGKNRMLEWIIPQQKPINFVSPIPKKIYKQFNEKQENSKHSNTTLLKQETAALLFLS